MTADSIVASLDHELKAKGFRRKKLTWNRAVGQFVDVVDLQTSKAGDTVTMNVGILSRPIYFLCWGRDIEGVVEEPFCTVRVRAGQLLDNTDRWWTIAGPRTVIEMVECLRERILPFLASMQSLEAMRDWLAAMGAPSPRDPLPAVNFAAVQSQLGDIGGACNTLATLKDEALGAWKVRAQEVAARIGCGRPPTGAR